MSVQISFVGGLGDAGLNIHERHYGEAGDSHSPFVVIHSYSPTDGGMLSVHFPANTVEDALRSLADWAGKIVVLADEALRARQGVVNAAVIRDLQATGLGAPGGIYPTEDLCDAED